MDVIGNLLTVERSIPKSVLAGLATGELSLHGGVVRNAAGQIVRHLIPAATRAVDPFGLISAPIDMFNTYQLHNIKKMSEQLMAISSSTMMMSGLGLTVSAVGFAVMHQSLKKVDRRLKDIGENVVWIKSFLESERHAAILDAAQDLENLPSDIEHRNQVLHTHRSKIGQVAMQYLQAWEESESSGLLEAMSYQHFYCTSFLIKARCSAELGMHDNAIVEIREGVSHWREKARYYANEKILGGNESKFFDRDSLSMVPTAKMIEWMDFAKDEERGWAWVDILRSSPKPVRTWPTPFSDPQQKFEKQHLVEIMDSLVKRSNVLDGYESQYKFLCDNQITPSKFESELRSIELKDAEDNVVVLAPIEAN